MRFHFYITKLIFSILLLQKTTAFLKAFDSFKNEITSFLDGSSNLGDLLRKFSKQDFFTKIYFLKDEIFEKMNSSALEKFISQGKNLPEMIKEKINMIKAKKFTKEEAMQRLNTQRNLKTSEVIVLLEKIGPIKDLSRAQVVNLRSIIPLIPNTRLLEITNKEALIRLEGSTTNDNKMYNMRLKEQLYWKTNPKPEDLDAPSGFLSFNKMPLEYFMRLKAETLKKKMKEAANFVYGSNMDFFTKQMYTSKILETLNLRSIKDEDTVIKEINNFQSGLKSVLMPEDFHSQVLDKSKIKFIVQTNMKNALRSDDQQLSLAAIKMIQKDFLQIGNVTKEKVKEKGGMDMLGVVLPSCLQDAVDREVFTVSAVDEIAMGIQKSSGYGTEAKLRILNNFTNKHFENVDAPLVSNFGIFAVENLDYSVLRRISSIEAKNVLKDKKMKLNKLQAFTCILKLSSTDLPSIKASYKELIPLTMVKDMNKEKLKDVAKDLDLSHAIAMKTGEKYFDSLTEINSDTIDRHKDVFKYISVKNAIKIKNEDFMKILEVLKDQTMTNQVARILHYKLGSFITPKMDKENDKSEENNEIEDDFPTLSKTERKHVSKMLQSSVTWGYVPIAILSPRNILNGIADENIIALLQRIAKGESKNDYLPLIKRALISKAFETFGNGIVKGELPLIGNDIDFIPAKAIYAASPYDFLMNLEKRLRNNKMTPCFDENQISAIENLITKGELHKNRRLSQSICCTLHLTSESFQKSLLPNIHLSLTCSCYFMEETLTNTKAEILCKSKTKRCLSDSTKTMKLEKLKASNKVFKELVGKVDHSHDGVTHSMLPCDQFAFGAIQSMSISDIENLNTTLLKMCIAWISVLPLNSNQYETIAARYLSERVNLENLDSSEFKALGSMLPFFSKFNLGDLNFKHNRPVPKVNMRDIYDAYAMIDKLKDFSQNEAQARELIYKFISDERPPNWDGGELALVRKFLCQIDRAEILQINKEAYRKALPLLSELKPCPQTEGSTNHMDRLINKIEDDPKDWTPKILAKLGNLASYLPPETLAKVKSDAYAGFRPQSVQTLDEDLIKSLKSEHLSHMSPSAIMSFTDDQKQSFSSEMTDLVNYLISQTEIRRNAASVKDIFVSVIISSLLIQVFVR